MRSDPAANEEASATAVRARLVDALEADLVGPFLPEGHPEAGREVLPLPPSRWYLTGFLAPQEAAQPDPEDPEAGDELAGGDESQAEDAGAPEPEPKRRQYFPSSMGLSVLLPPARRAGVGAGDGSGSGADSAELLDVVVRYADYEKEEVAEDHEERARFGWRRVSRRPEAIAVPLDPAALARGVQVPESGGLVLRGELRTTEMDGLEPGTRVLSLFLVNERAPRDKDRDLSFAFQVVMTLRFEAGFCPRPNRQGEDAADDDARVLALQFRNHAEWAVGHNTSAVRPEPDEDGVVRELRTTQLPCHEVPPVRHVAVEGATLEMARLARLADGDGADGGGRVGGAGGGGGGGESGEGGEGGEGGGTGGGEELARALSPVVDEYGAWIDAQRSVALERRALSDTRDALCDKAERARERMREGIELLRTDAQVRQAFSFANQAMHVAAKQGDARREKPRYAKGEQPTWRVFQLGFILLNLASIVDPHHRDRKIADLIYFPTGGGKTEAYLGLIAFTLLLRRMRGKSRPDEGRGVTVVLRYTLRLLTLDQLGRAATLTCALEALRHQRPKLLGNARFTVGLWVGRSATANRLAEIHAALHDFQEGDERSPFPLAACPWCGAEIRRRNVKLVDDAGEPSKTRYTRAVVYCDEVGCLFTEKKRKGAGLPVLFADEQIYRELPDFLVATVDKFALMPWLGETGMLFGRATHLDERRAHGVMHRPPAEATLLPDGLLPPELIVQDEMHLISGPLGTMVGLYETAIDYLSERRVESNGERQLEPNGERQDEREGVRRVPKVICSTATVRRAREQVLALFQRDMAVFPPRGVDDGDNWFSSIDRERPGRLYVGVAAPGRALRAVSVRAYATLLAAGQAHFDPDGPLDQPADPYMTLVGYFNSLRELGGMRRLVEDEVRTRVAKFGETKTPHHHVGAHPWAANRSVRMPAELTSREKTEAVKLTKERLATPRAADAGGESSGDGSSLDVVLASSMISVGLDVDRLGLMVVTGQPKTSAEYIQATSRVGRARPGLVVTCLNASRPRDRSHFERFVAYHESFYREVEATSVTPFSNQTLDRGMVGTLTAMVRHGIEDMEPPRGFMRLHDHREAAEAVLAAFVERGCHHRPHGTEAEERMSHGLQQRGRALFDSWEKVAAGGREGAAERVYSALDRRRTEGKPVLRSPTDEPPDDDDERRFVAPTSMRDVEPSTHVWMRFKQLDEKG